MSPPSFGVVDCSSLQPRDMLAKSLPFGDGLAYNPSSIVQGGVCCATDGPIPLVTCFHQVETIEGVENGLI